MHGAPRFDDWSTRWHPLARAAGIAPDERLILALSGGADSVLLLHWIAAARPLVDLLAVHVDHGLRGAESDGDARFVAELCRSLDVPLRVLRAELDPEGGNLEARARAERYRLLTREARRTRRRTVLTGHHADDALETLLLRWVRGSELAGLRGPRPELLWTAGEGEPPLEPVRVVRPLLAFRREEVRALLAARGLAWREDSSNADPRFLRSRVRHQLLPMVREQAGPEVVEELRAFGRAVEELEDRLARATAHLAWRPAPHAAVSRTERERTLGGVLERGPLMELARPLARRVLWRLLTEGTGQSPSRALQEKVLDDLARGRCTRHALGGGWILALRARELLLLPPRSVATAGDGGQLALPFPAPDRSPASAQPLELAVPGSITLEDGRRITAEIAESTPDAPVARGLEVELDARGLPLHLHVRWPRPGDRFRALGAPGSRPLVRFLADRGIPREERARIPLVLEGTEILWVAGIEPCDRRRLGHATRRRLRLVLHP